MDVVRRKRYRSPFGFSITELLFTTLLLGLSMAVFGELAVVTTISTAKVSNKVDGLAAARSAIDRISGDVRLARAVGDFYGVGVERLSFPSTTNPIYNGVRQPTGGWPGAPWNYRMQVSDTTLILQIPVVYLDPKNDPLNSLYSAAASENSANGFPIMLPKDNFGTDDPPANMENLYTVVYQVVPDSTRPGEYLLQMARFPGAQISALASSYKGAINPPQTILKGLVNPRPTGSTSGPPSVFSYLARPLKTAPPGYNPSRYDRVAPSAASIPLVTGVGIDLEVKNTGISTDNGDGSYAQSVGIHSEAFMKYNRNIDFANTTNLSTGP